MTPPPLSVAFPLQLVKQKRRDREPSLNPLTNWITTKQNTNKT